MIGGDLRWYTVADTIRQAVRAALTTPVQQSCVVPGTIAWDNCCGMLAASVGTIFLSDRFPEQERAVVGSRCDVAWEVAEIAFQLVRCAPVQDERGNPPTCAQLDTAAQLWAQDAHILMASVASAVCSMRDSNQIIDYLVQTVVPQGPQGACVGSELRVFISLPRV